jgi:hypothetical protein
MNETPPSSLALKKRCSDSWNSDPPQVTSYIAYPQTGVVDHPTTYTSESCGLGWRFQITESREQTPTPDHVFEVVKQLDVTFQPGVCSPMSLSPVWINVKVSYPSDAAPTLEMEFISVPTRLNKFIGSYRAPPLYKGQTHIEITLTFSDSDGLSFPNTSPPSATEALRQSLETSSFVDSKFYLFSAKIRGRPALPRAVYATLPLVIDRSTHLRNCEPFSFAPFLYLGESGLL